MAMKQGIILLALMLVQNSCREQKACRFEANADRIKSTCSLANGVQIKKLGDVVLNSDGFPSNYEVVYWASYGSKSEAEFRRVFKNGLKEIVFKHQMAGYRWIFHESGTVSDTLPFNFEMNNWYLIDDLYEGGAPTVQLFIYVKEGGSFTTFRSDSKTNM